MKASRTINAIGALAGVALITMTGLIAEHKTTEPPPWLAATDRGIELQRPDEPASNINPLYAHDVDAVAKILMDPAVVGPAAVIQPGTPDPEGTRCCGDFLESLTNAYATATEAAAGGDAYLGTTHPIWGVGTAQNFIRRHTPPDSRHLSRTPECRPQDNCHTEHSSGHPAP